MSDTIKFKVIQDPTTKNVNLYIYRPYGIDNDWMTVDKFNEMTVMELKSLTKYLISIFNTKK
jgi:hypothetical protein